jgi:hypothetical protein
MMLIRLAFLVLLVLGFGAAQASEAELALMPGEVIKGHAKYEANCKECHTRFDKDAQKGLCKNCHKEVKVDVDDKKGFHGTLEEKECNVCHTDHKGRDAKIVIFDEGKFKHDKTDFPLKGAHDKKEKVKCQDCHDTKKKYREAPLECNGCHRKDDKHKGSLGSGCEKCHTENNWKEWKFDHSKTKFLLTGKHADVKCNKCHLEAPASYKDAQTTCYGCHKKDDKHKGLYGKKCETCHVDKSWKTIEFDHDKETKYKLKGEHIKTKCTACHLEPLYQNKKTPDTCFACHKKVDVHKGALGEKCETCHNEEEWKTTKFDHDKTKYPLLGKHVTTKCEACHLPNMKEKLAMTCIGCHKIDDKHKDGFGAKCESCHREKDWKTLKFDHTKDTKYPLVDKHIKVKCTDCHTEKIATQKLSHECVACHKKDDVHKEKLGKKCQSCHDIKDWKKAHIDHARSRFPLMGAHIIVDCKKCHTTQLYRDAPLDCFSCHKKDDEKTHKMRMGKKCETCHNARAWSAWDYNHDKLTKFKLDGGHKKPGCYACHKQVVVDGKFVVERTCGGCHDKDDKHQGEFGPLCERCHTTSKWSTLLVGGSNKPAK